MQCQRLIGMIKSWYNHVRDETMAPARMVSFMEQHATTCTVCQEDPDVKDEIAKITELILPESKIPKAVRQQNDDDDEDDSDYDETDDSEDLDTDEEEEDMGDDIDEEDELELNDIDEEDE
jgi:hypothetical protein